MIKKHKQLIMGFILGALLFTIIPANAMVQEYILKKSPDKFIVDGEEIVNKKLPMLKYGGYNYIPAGTFREICDKIGVGFEWVGEKKEIRIDTSKEDKSTTVRERDDRVENIVKESGHLINENGVKFISLRGVMEYLVDNSDDCKIRYLQDTGEFEIFRTNKGADIVLLTGKVAKIHQASGYIEYDYFVNHILPLVK